MAIAVILYNHAKSNIERVTQAPLKIDMSMINYLDYYQWIDEERLSWECILFHMINHTIMTAAFILTMMVPAMQYQD